MHPCMFFFLFSNKMLDIRTEVNKRLARRSLIRLLLLKQSDLGLGCLS